MMTFTCDTCGDALSNPPPPTCVTLTVMMQVPSPEPAAPTVQQLLYYVCEKHDPAGISNALHGALGTLPAKAAA
jgi:hypothetical protein